jgi:hypothetical protein
MQIQQRMLLCAVGMPPPNVRAVPVTVFERCYAIIITFASTCLVFHKAHSTLCGIVQLPAPCWAVIQCFLPSSKNAVKLNQAFDWQSTDLVHAGLSKGCVPASSAWLQDCGYPANCTCAVQAACVTAVTVALMLQHCSFRVSYYKDCMLCGAEIFKGAEMVHECTKCVAVWCLYVCCELECVQYAAGTSCLLQACVDDSMQQVYTWHS